MMNDEKENSLSSFFSLPFNNNVLDYFSAVSYNVAEKTIEF